MLPIWRAIYHCDQDQTFTWNCNIYDRYQTKEIISELNANVGTFIVWAY